MISILFYAGIGAASRGWRRALFKRGVKTLKHHFELCIEYLDYPDFRPDAVTFCECVPKKKKGGILFLFSECAYFICYRVYFNVKTILEHIVGKELYCVPS